MPVYPAFVEGIYLLPDTPNSNEAPAWFSVSCRGLSFTLTGALPSALFLWRRHLGIMNVPDLGKAGIQGDYNVGRDKKAKKRTGYS